MKKTFLGISIAIILIVSTITFSSAQNPYTNGNIEGFVKSIVENSIAIEDYNGRVYSFPITSTTQYSIDQREAKLSDFKPGLEINAKLKLGKITSIEGYSTENFGYITPGRKVRTGTIKKIDRDQIILKLSSGTEETYFSSPATLLTRKGVNIPLSTLYEGDNVKLFFNEIDNSTIARIEVQGDSVVIKDLYKGRLTGTDSYDNAVTVADTEVYRNGNWESLSSSMKLYFKDGANIYTGGQKIVNENLKYYNGKTVYMAAANFFGSNRIEKMVVKNQNEALYSEKINDLNFFTGAFELSNNVNVLFNEGSIIIKNGRLVDQYSLNTLSSAFVVADGRGSSQMADVVYVYDEDINNSNIGENYLYAGTLDEITPGKVQLKNFYILNKNNWESFTGSKELYFDNDTDIYDLENRKMVSFKEFYSLDYAVDQDSGTKRDWNVYLYTDGDRISAAVVSRNMDSLLNQRITNGVINNVAEDSLVGWTVNFRNSSDWSSRNEKWMGRSVSLAINIDKAMVLRNGRIIEKDELKTGDRLYIVRNDTEAKLVIVK